jgi:hypothetical protein
MRRNETTHMSDFEEFCKSLGVSLNRGPAAIAYTKANDIVELQIAAGYWRLNNDAFCACALVDLCSIRDFFKVAHRWPELSDLGSILHYGVSVSQS